MKEGQIHKTMTLHNIFKLSGECEYGVTFPSIEFY